MLDLLSEEQGRRYIAELKADYDRVREQHANKKATPLVTLADGRANKTPPRLIWATDDAAGAKISSAGASCAR